MQVTIVARGNLESARNGDIVCNVRSGAKGSTNATTIKWLIDNGTEVKKGDRSSSWMIPASRSNSRPRTSNVDNAKADMVKADEHYRIDEIQAQSDIEKAVNARDLAKLDLEKYIEGRFHPVPQGRRGPH